MKVQELTPAMLDEWIHTLQKAVKMPKNVPRNVVKRHIISPERFKALLDKYSFGSYGNANQQAENVRQSKGLPAPAAEKVSFRHIQESANYTEYKILQTNREWRQIADKK